MLQCNTYLFFSLYKNQPNIWQFIINLYFFRKRASLVTTIFLVIGLQNYLSPLPAICVQHSFFWKVYRDYTMIFMLLPRPRKLFNLPENLFCSRFSYVDFTVKSQHEQAKIFSFNLGPVESAYCLIIRQFRKGIVKVNVLKLTFA